jgi:hypothetical protein
MNHLIFYTATNNPTKKKPNRVDADGAFIPEARNLSEYLNSCEGNCIMIPIKTYKSSAADMRRQVEASLVSAKNLGVEFHAAWFLCHGYKHSIQFGYKWVSGAQRLIRKITECAPSVEMINFYCCNVAMNRNNFAEWTFSALQEKSNAKNVQVFGHYTAGHTTMNPRIKIYATGYQPFIWSTRGVAGYNELVKADKAATIERMRDVGDDLRFSIPFYPEIMRENGFTWGWK